MGYLPLFTLLPTPKLPTPAVHTSEPPLLTYLLTLLHTPLATSLPLRNIISDLSLPIHTQPFTPNLSTNLHTDPSHRTSTTTLPTKPSQVLVSGHVATGRFGDVSFLNEDRLALVSPPDRQRAARDGQPAWLSAVPQASSTRSRVHHLMTVWVVGWPSAPWGASRYPDG